MRCDHIVIEAVRPIVTPNVSVVALLEELQLCLRQCLVVS